MADEYFDQVMGTISRTGGSIGQLVFGVAKAEILLLMWLYKQVKKGVASLAAADHYKAFLAKNEGHVQGTTIMLSEESAKRLAAAVPDSGSEYIETKQLRSLCPELSELEKLKADFYVMPVKPGTSSLQLVVSDKSMPIVKTWHAQHLQNLSKGGLKDYEYLKTLTNGQCVLKSINLEGDGFRVFLDDLSKLGASYAILPDLKVGDGRSQFAIASRDISKVDFWIQQKNLQEIAANGLKKTTVETISEEGYLNTADGIDLDRYDQFAGTDQAHPEEGIDYRDEKALSERTVSAGAAVRQTESPEYRKYKEQGRYRELSVNQVLVDAVPADLRAEAAQKGTFLCAIPGKDRSEYLAVPLSSSFHEIGNEGNYRIFIDKTKHPVVVNKSGNAVPMTYESMEQRWNKAKEGKQMMKQLAKQEPQPGKKPQISK